MKLSKKVISHALILFVAWKITKIEFMIRPNNKSSDFEILKNLIKSK
ncbi:hypothetical protein MKY53_02860 [Macrococcus sp. FSL R5-0951]|nr:hypothetical protein [Macrococcus caseolyticus]